MNVLEKEESYRISGRYTWQDGVLYPAYSAAFIEFAFCGTRACATMISGEFAEDELFAAQAAVFVDGEDVPRKRFPLKKGRHEYELYVSGEAKPVTIRLMKYSENAFAAMGIASIDVDGELLACPKPKEKALEFIGDSITCGYGIEGILDKDVFCTSQENPWEAYACKTARKLGMEFELVSWSGNGIISHYVEPDVDVPRHEKPLMPELYPFADLELDSRLHTAEPTKWMPKKLPDIEVIHLGTNDCSFAREIPERNEVFLREYKNFVRSVRAYNPTAPIICMLGVMDQRLNPTLGRAVLELRDEGMEQVFFLDCPEQLEEDGKGTDYHPSPVTHEKVASRLAEFIRSLPV